MPDIKAGVHPAEGQEEKERYEEALAGAREKAIRCAREASRFKALDIVVLDVSRFSSFADFFIICSGKSTRQVQGIADNLEDSLATHRLKPLGVEGRTESHWILMDYGDVIVHVFYEPIRLFYDLESLWSEAGEVPWEDEHVPVSRPEEVAEEEP